MRHQVAQFSSILSTTLHSRKNQKLLKVPYFAGRAPPSTPALRVPGSSEALSCPAVHLSRPPALVSGAYRLHAAPCPKCCFCCTPCPRSLSLALPICFYSILPTSATDHPQPCPPSPRSPPAHPLWYPPAAACPAWTARPCVSQVSSRKSPARFPHDVFVGASSAHLRAHTYALDLLLPETPVPRRRGMPASHVPTCGNRPASRVDTGQFVTRSFRRLFPPPPFCYHLHRLFLHRQQHL